MDRDTRHQKPLETSKPPDEYEAVSRAMHSSEAEYDSYSQHAASYQKKHRHVVRKMLIILGAVVFLVATAFGVYALLKEDGKGQTDKNETNQQSQPTSNQGLSEEITTKTEHYVSSSFMLEFDHPEDWTVAETTGGGQLTVQSPSLRLKSADGETLTGQIVFKIRSKQQPLPEFDGGNALAVRESEKIAYLKPSSAQRGSTYLSFLRYAGAAAGIDGLYITGDYGYQKDQAVPKADFASVDPIISLTFARCSDNSCSGESTPLALAEDAWQNTNFSKPLKSIFQSLTIN